MGFDARVRMLRAARGWSLQRLAETSHVSRSYLYQIETGCSSPTLQIVEALAAAFDLTVLALLAPLYDDDAPFPLTDRR